MVSLGKAGLKIAAILDLLAIIVITPFLHTLITIETEILNYVVINTAIISWCQVSLFNKIYYMNN